MLRLGCQSNYLVFDPIFFIIAQLSQCVPEQQLPNLKQMHWDIAKLLELGVDEKFLLESDITPEQARDLVKGLLYLKERFDKSKE